jgi:competence protein ComEA
VAVSGAVHLPGTYGFDMGDRVADALGRAGGARDDANLADINLAAPLIDGTTLPVPALPVAGVRGGTLTMRRAAPAPPVPAAYTLSGWRPPPPPAVVPAPGAVATGADPAVAPAETTTLPGIDLNKATKEQLESLPGIGPVLASRILEERSRGRFQSIDDLQRVSGIGPKRLEALRPLAHATP